MDFVAYWRMIRGRPAGAPLLPGLTQMAPGNGNNHVTLYAHAPTCLLGTPNVATMPGAMPGAMPAAGDPMSPEPAARNRMPAGAQQ